MRSTASFVLVVDMDHASFVRYKSRKNTLRLNIQVRHATPICFIKREVSPFFRRFCPFCTRKLLKSFTKDNI
ncbi:hypothetical protein BT69DRAFT_710871 [Atractiella rhizophila]|nr:hypothetical protein BT69DRAFT_710871 [Atractiella rhizophila]